MFYNISFLFSQIISPLLLTIFAFFFLSFFWKKIFNFFQLKNYENVQRIHDNEVSRLGGLIIYIFLWSVSIFPLNNNKFLFSLLIASIPFVLISLKEDLFHNTTPQIRLILMILSCFIFFYTYPINFPKIDIPVIGEIISYYPIDIIFFTFLILVIMNGMNLIDGVNGLFGINAIYQLLVLAFLSSLTNDVLSLTLISIFLIPLLIFLLFNFPFGKIFVGDTGAYLYGFIISLLTIHLFGNSYLLSWVAVLVLFYPSMELLFSFIRKSLNKQSPFYPDNQHLHTILYRRLLRYEFIPNKFTSSLVAIIISSLFLIPGSVIIICFNKSLYMILSAVILSIIIYLYLYLYLTKWQKRNIDENS